MDIFTFFSHLSLSLNQEEAIKKLESFITGSTKIFMLKGYAGSGKTTMLKGLVEYLNSVGLDFALMAPTGRAAKVIREKTGKEAQTIHKSIYSYDEMVEVEDGDSFVYSYIRAVFSGEAYLEIIKPCRLNIFRDIGKKLFQ